MRADQLLLAQGLAPTRSAAQRLIDGTAAEWLSPAGWSLVRKAGQELPDKAQLRVTDDAELRYVSRGGLKLEGALRTAGLAVVGLTALDVGQSTGGFTDCLLKYGASTVVGFDVGHGQLNAALMADPRVVALENLHVRELADSALATHAPADGFDLIAGDLSFISMLGALPFLAPWLSAKGQVLLLIKPQFEVGPKHVSRGGLVKDTAQYALLETRARAACAALGWRVNGYFPSTITGGDGNTEFFLWATR